MKYENLRDPRQIIAKIDKIMEAVNKKYNELDSNYMHLFDGPKFPHESEVDQFKMICEVIKENFIYVHPIDSDHNQKPFKDI